jgi:hypothetical protein
VNPVPDRGGSMFHHIAFLKLDANLPHDFDANVERQLVLLRVACEGLIEIFLRSNVSDRSQGFSHGIVSIFTSSEAHDEYQLSEVHQAFKRYMEPFIQATAFFDCEV